MEQPIISLKKSDECAAAALRRIIVLAVFLYIGAETAFSADVAAVYVNNEKIRDYIETLSQGYKSKGEDIIKRTASIDGFIQGNIILWETFTVDERKKRIKYFEKMLADFYKAEKGSFDAQRINMRNEFSERVSLIIKDVMKRNKTHVIVEINKKCKCC